MHDTRSTRPEDTATPGPSASQLRQLVVTAATGLDVDTVAPTDAAAALEHWTAIKHAAAAVERDLALRAATGDAMRNAGAKDAASWMASKTGTTAAQGREALGTAKRARQLPATAAKARQGELSPGQAAAIADAAKADPAAEQKLLDAATRESLGELRDRCARQKAAADRDPEAARRRIHAARRVNRWASPDGMHHLHAAGPAEDIASIVAAMKPHLETRFTRARTDGVREGYEAYEFDAPVALADTATFIQVTNAGHTRPTPRHHPFILRGRETPGGAEDGGRSRACEGAVGRHRRGQDPASPGGPPATLAQQVALLWQTPGCTREECARRQRLETDHRIDWAHTQHTRLDELDRLCQHCHALKTRHGWALVTGTGRRPMVPPRPPPPPGPPRRPATTSLRVGRPDQPPSATPPSGGGIGAPAPGSMMPVGARIQGRRRLGDQRSGPSVPSTVGGVREFGCSTVVRTSRGALPSARRRWARRVPVVAGPGACRRPLPTTVSSTPTTPPPKGHHHLLARWRPNRRPAYGAHGGDARAPGKGGRAGSTLLPAQPPGIAEAGRTACVPAPGRWAQGAVAYGAGMRRIGRTFRKGVLLGVVVGLVVAVAKALRVGTPDGNTPLDARPAPPAQPEAASAAWAAAPVVVPEPLPPTVPVPVTDVEAAAPAEPRVVAKRAAKKANPRKAVAKTASAKKAPAKRVAAEKADRAVPGWVDPEGRTCPASHPVKVKLASGIFHVAGGLAYDRTIADRCYRDPAAAEADGHRAAKR